MRRSYQLRLSVLQVQLLIATASAGAQNIEEGRRYFEQGRNAEARAVFLRLQESDAITGQPEYYLGRVAMHFNELDDAIRQFERAITRDDKSALYHAWLGNALRDKAIGAPFFRKPFLGRRVMAEWKRALALDPTLHQVRLSLLKFYAYVPGFAGGGIGRARTEAEFLTKSDALYGAVAHGILAEGAKDTVAERRSYERAIAVAPDSLLGYLQLAELHLRFNRTAEAIATLDAFAKRHPANGWGQYHFGRVAATGGTQLDEARSALQRFVASPPADVTVADLRAARALLRRLARAPK